MKIENMKIDDVYKNEENFKKVEKSLLKKFNVESVRDIKHSDVFESISSSNRYGMREHRGFIKEDVELCDAELIVILRPFFYWFGGTCRIDKKTKSFVVAIY